MAELYAIVGSMKRARLMLEAGVPTLQLRFKEILLAPHREEIAGWRDRYPDTRLVINDEMEFAVQVGAWGTHLGQEDVLRYPPERLRHAPVHLSISTHDDREIATAIDLGAKAIGFGPVYSTTTKALAHEPQGAARLAAVVARVGVPVVAIGGITEAHLDEVVATGVQDVAMIGQLDAYTDAAAVQALADRVRGTSMQ